MTDNGTKNLLDQWLGEGEIVTLPSGKQARLRSIDGLSLMDEDNALTNIFLSQIAGHMNPNAPQAKPETIMEGNGEIQLTAANLREGMPMINRIVKATFVEPAIVDTQEEVDARRGILLHHIPLTDKIAVLSWAIGGRQAMQTTRFLQQSRGDMGRVSKGHSAQNKTKR